MLMSRDRSFSCGRYRCAVTTMAFVFALCSYPFLEEAHAQGGLPWEIEAPPGATESFGAVVASGGDANGDGIDDVFIMDPSYLNEDGEPFGKWWVYSGADQSVLWTMDGEYRNNSPSNCAAFLDDLDGDGGAEIILGRPSLDGRTLGTVGIYSGRNGSLLMEYREEASFGRDVCHAGDVDGDGVGDYAYVVRHSFNSGEVSPVLVRSGATHEVILEAFGDPPRRVRGAGDIDGDGFDDLVVGSWSNSRSGEPMRIFGGGDSGWIIEIERPYDDQFFGYQIAAGADLTRDGVPDIAVTSGLGSYSVRIISGFTFTNVNEIFPPEGVDDQYFGWELELGDVNGDGRAEVIVVTNGISRPGTIISFDGLSGDIVHWTTGDIVGVSNVVSGNSVGVGNLNADRFIDTIHGTDDTEPSRVIAHAGATLSLRWEPNYNGFLQRGAEVQMELRGALPERTVRLLASPAGNGCTYIPRLDICIDLNQPIVQVMTSETDENGEALFEFTVPIGAPLGDVWFQAFDPNHWWMGPVTSNVIRLEIVE